MKWIHIPEDRSKCLPEQWQCRVGERSVAVLRWSDDGFSRNYWQSVMQGPDDAIVSLVVTSSSDINRAKDEVEQTLRDMGWK